jgi:hypothetical protein
MKKREFEVSGFKIISDDHPFAVVLIADFICQIIVYKENATKHK